MFEEKVSYPLGWLFWENLGLHTAAKTLKHNLMHCFHISGFCGSNAKSQNRYGISYLYIFSERLLVAVLDYPEHWYSGGMPHLLLEFISTRFRAQKSCCALSSLEVCAVNVASVTWYFMEIEWMLLYMDKSGTGLESQFLPSLGLENSSLSRLDSFPALQSEHFLRTACLSFLLLNLFRRTLLIFEVEKPAQCLIFSFFSTNELSFQNKNPLLFSPSDYSTQLITVKNTTEDL